MTAKQCRDCGEVKPASQLVKTKRQPDGVTNWCLQCNAAYQRRQRDTPTVQTNRARRAARVAAVAAGLKLCSKCLKQRPQTNFSSDASKVDGLRTACRDCHNEARRAQYRSNPVKYIAAVAERRAMKYAATVGKIDYAAVLAAPDCYLCGCALDLLAGDVDVDHVVPLTRGGAHCMANLRATHKGCNRRKQNKTLAELHWYAGPVDLGLSLLSATMTDADSRPAGPVASPTTDPV